MDPSHKSYSGRASDAWSLGIVLFTLLLGRYPFHHHSISAMFTKIARAKFQIPPSSGLSVEAKLLLRSLIRLKPDERLLPHEVLMHSWLRQADTNYHTSLFLSQNEHLTKSTNFLSGNNFIQQLSSANTHKPLGYSLSAPVGRTSYSPSDSTLLSSSSSSPSYFSQLSQTSSLFPYFKRSPISDRSVPVFDPPIQQQHQRV